MPPGSFLFDLTDFLDPVPEAAWLTAITSGWDVVPIVVQDPTWEASFPVSVGRLVLPLADPVDGRTELIRLSAGKSTTTGGDQLDKQLRAMGAAECK